MNFFLIQLGDTQLMGKARKKGGGLHCPPSFLVSFRVLRNSYQYQQFSWKQLDNVPGRSWFGMGKQVKGSERSGYLNERVPTI
jgi:hypothetical protein